MAMVKCAECGTEISDKAAACVRCGAPLVARGPTNTLAVTVQKESKPMWWLWVPLGLLGAFLLFGALIPKNVAEANAFAQTCRDLVKQGATTQYECDQTEAEIRARK